MKGTILKGAIKYKSHLPFSAVLLAFSFTLLNSVHPVASLTCVTVNAAKRHAAAKVSNMHQQASSLFPMTSTATP